MSVLLCCDDDDDDDRESVRPGPRMNEARDDVDTWTWREKGPTNRIIRVGYCTRKSPFQVTRLLAGQSLPTHGSTDITYLVRRISRIFLLIRNALGTQDAEWEGEQNQRYAGHLVWGIRGA